MSKRQLSIEEACNCSAKRTATNEASQVILPPAEELLGDSVDVDLELRTEVLESEPSHSVSEYDEHSDESEHMYIELLQGPNQPRSGVFPKRQFGQKKPEYRSFKPSWFDNKTGFTGRVVIIKYTASYVEMFMF